MALSGDQLSSATPTRLLCRSGRWVLELTRLEPVDRNVFQPRTQRLEGTDTILAVLRRSPEGHMLATSAAQLMRSVRSDENRAFEAGESEWLPSAEPPEPERSPAVSAAEEERRSFSRLVAELQAELAVLRASHTRLRERVAALEAQRSGLPLPASRPARAPGRARRKSEPPRSLPAATSAGAAVPDPLAATVASPVMTPSALAAGPEPGPQSLEGLAAALLGSDGAAFEPLAQPTPAAIHACLQTLMTDVPKLSPCVTPVDFATLSRPHVSRLLDDDGQERGMVVADLPAMARLTGALLSDPDLTQQQLEAGAPSEDGLLAMAELGNHLAGIFSAVPNNARVRATPVTPLDVAELPRARTRSDFDVSGGTLVLLGI
jgi:hypothetical protein